MIVLAHLVLMEVLLVTGLRYAGTGWALVPVAVGLVYAVLLTRRDARRGAR